MVSLSPTCYSHLPFIFNTAARDFYPGSVTEAYLVRNSTIAFMSSMIKYYLCSILFTSHYDLISATSPASLPTLLTKCQSQSQSLGYLGELENNFVKTYDQILWVQKCMFKNSFQYLSSSRRVINYWTPSDLELLHFLIHSIC
jgi:hypothetical protein